MIGKTHRFHGHNSLNYVYRNGETVRGPLTALKYAVNKRRESYRVAVVVSKKVHKSAVVRNRIRRRLYEQVRLISGQIQEPYDIVFTVFHDTVAELPSEELATLVRAQLHQAKIV
jgi:ribonuclease P protein component